MSLSWSVLVLTLIGGEDPQPSQPNPPRSPAPVEVRVDGLAAPGSKPGSPVAPEAAEHRERPIPLPKVAAPRVTQDAQTQETWPLTLSEAIRIALDNSEIVRVIIVGPQPTSIGGFEPSFTNPKAYRRWCESNLAPIVISRVNAETDPCRFKAEVLTLVRSVEQRYWDLAQAHVQLWGTERAVKLAKEILDREEAELSPGRGTVADVAEASQRLEQFNLDRVTRTSDVVTTERQLRNILGLPPTDNRRITPVTPATEVRQGLDWQTCLREMLEQQPDIVQKKLAMGPLPSSLVEPGPAGVLRVGNAGPGGDPEKIRQQDDLEHVIRQAAQTLAREFLAVDAGFQKVELSARLRKAAAQRLDAQRAYYEEGRITIDRFLDAVSQHATAVASEAQYKTMYSISIATLAAARGTLLTDRGIVIADRAPRPGTGLALSVEPAEAGRR